MEERTKTYAYLIDEVCSPKNKSNKLVREILPILVKWAKIGCTNKTYGDLNRLIGYKDGKNQSIGHQLGCINNILQRLTDATGVDIPTPNCLVCNAQTGLPSDGFDFVKDCYKDMSSDEKRKYVRLLNAEAINYRNWDWVLAQLGLSPFIFSKDEEAIRSGKVHGYGGEGVEHKALKEYIAHHPQIVGAKELGNNEYILLSADRLDVWFPESKIAVEVKPISSPDADILRGLFQCVKYKAILDAEDNIKGKIPNSKTVLVIEGQLNSDNLKIKNALGINVIENFKRK